MDKEMTLGERLKYFRKKNGYRQEDIAKILNIHRTTYTYYESDRTEPDLAKIKVLAELYNIELRELLTESKSRSEILSDSGMFIGRRNNTSAMINSSELELIRMIRKLSNEEQTELIKILKEKMNDKK